MERRSGSRYGGGPNDQAHYNWTEETLRDHFRNSSEKMRAFLRYLAEQADEDVTLA